MHKMQDSGLSMDYFQLSMLNRKHDFLFLNFISFWDYFERGNGRNYLLRPELIVLVDFKAIYPRVPPGYFRGFPWGGAFPKFWRNLPIP